MTAATSIHGGKSQREIDLNRDLQRDLWCVMGLPFDATTESATYNHLIECIEKKEKCFLTTPNLNFVVAAQDDASFRKTVIDSDWVIADGMPIIWAARALGVPLHERVAGSSVFDRLRNEYRQHDRPLRVVFFGGPDGVAAEAFKKIAVDDSAMEVVGFYSPGFGTIDEMSPQHVIDQINESEADIVLVALGAKRGQQWIDFNRQRLNAPVISHLGAVVNFVAGTVSRAPMWMQKTGLEWIWRIWEERSLFKRYWLDGQVFLKSYFNSIRPLKKLTADLSSRQPVPFSFKHDSQRKCLNLSGDICSERLQLLRPEFVRQIHNGELECIDLAEVKYFDPSFVALLMIIQKQLKLDGIQLKLTSVTPLHQQLIRLCGALDELKAALP